MELPSERSSKKRKRDVKSTTLEGLVTSPRAQNNKNRKDTKENRRAKSTLLLSSKRANKWTVSANIDKHAMQKDNSKTPPHSALAAADLQNMTMTDKSLISPVKSPSSSFLQRITSPLQNSKLASLRSPLHTTLTNGKLNAGSLFNNEKILKTPKSGNEDEDFWMTPSKTTLKSVFASAEKQQNPMEAIQLPKLQNIPLPIFPVPQNHSQEQKSNPLHFQHHDSSHRQHHHHHHHHTTSPTPLSKSNGTPKPEPTTLTTSMNVFGDKTPPRNVSADLNNHSRSTTPVTQRKLIPPNAPTHVRSSIMRNRIGDVFDNMNLNSARTARDVSPLGDVEPIDLLDLFRSPSSRKRKRQKVGL